MNNTCKRQYTIKVTEGNAWGLLLRLKSQTYVSSKPVDVDIEARHLENISIEVGGKQWDDYSVEDEGVLVNIPATMACGVYSVKLTATYFDVDICAAYFECFAIVPWSYQSTAGNYIPESPVATEAAYIYVGVIDDAELEALKAAWRLKIAAAEAAKAAAEAAREEFDTKAETLTGTIGSQQDTIGSQQDTITSQQRTIAEQEDTIESQELTIQQQEQDILELDEYLENYDPMVREIITILRQAGIYVSEENVDHDDMRLPLRYLVNVMRNQFPEYVETDPITFFPFTSIPTIPNDIEVFDGRGFNFVGTSMKNMFYNKTQLREVKHFGAINSINVTTMEGMFNGCSSLQNVDLSDFDMSNVTIMSNAFTGCASLQNIDINGLDTSNVTDMTAMFRNCNALLRINMQGLDTSNVISADYFLFQSRNIVWGDFRGTDVTKLNNYKFITDGSPYFVRNTVVGDATYEEVIATDTYVCRNINSSQNINYMTSLNQASLRALINGLADRTGQSSLTLTLGSTLRNKLSADDIAVATAKNWTIA